MDELGKVHQLIIPFLGHNMTFNLDAILMTWIVFVVLIIFGFFASKNKNMLPGPYRYWGGIVCVPTV